MSVGDYMTCIEYILKKQNLTATHICDNGSIFRAQFTDWVKKRRPVPAKHIAVLEEALGIPERYFLDSKRYALELEEKEKAKIDLRFCDDEKEREVYRKNLENALRVERFRKLIENEANLEEVDAFLNTVRVSHSVYSKPKPTAPKRNDDGPFVVVSSR
jgi:transcriptional regulator with XRE-family HTH domain